jgi:hypothetical protein
LLLLLLLFFFFFFLFLRLFTPRYCLRCYAIYEAELAGDRSCCYHSLEPEFHYVHHDSSTQFRKFHCCGQNDRVVPVRGCCFDSHEAFDISNLPAKK